MQGRGTQSPSPLRRFNNEQLLGKKVCPNSVATHKLLTVLRVTPGKLPDGIISLFLGWVPYVGEQMLIPVSSGKNFTQQLFKKQVVWGEDSAGGALAMYA